jgi:hypothetical protein
VLAGLGKAAHEIQALVGRRDQEDRVDRRVVGERVDAVGGRETEFRRERLALVPVRE